MGGWVDEFPVWRLLHRADLSAEWREAEKFPALCLKGEMATKAQSCSSFSDDRAGLTWGRGGSGAEGCDEKSENNCRELHLPVG